MLENIYYNKAGQKELSCNECVIISLKNSLNAIWGISVLDISQMRRSYGQRYFFKVLCICLEVYIK